MRNIPKTSGKKNTTSSDLKIMPEAQLSVVLTVPKNSQEYDTLDKMLKALLIASNYAEDHELTPFVHAIADLIEAYDKDHTHWEKPNPIDMIKFLMEQHDLTQSDLPEIGKQSVVSKVLNGKQKLTTDQIKALSHRFGLSPDVFF